jgi:hypothetical protein
MSFYEFYPISMQHKNQPLIPPHLNYSNEEENSRTKLIVAESDVFTIFFEINRYILREGIIFF